jgi:hypothetical protein
VSLAANCPPNCLEQEDMNKCGVLPLELCAILCYSPITILNDVCSVLILCRHPTADECIHTDERKIVGTWVVDEMQNAVHKGCILIPVFEFWEHNLEQYSDNSGGVFTEHISMFLKPKQEAPDYPG